MLHAMILRVESTRKAELADLCSLLLPDESSAYLGLVLRTSAGKTIPLTIERTSVCSTTTRRCVIGIRSSAPSALSPTNWYIAGRSAARLRRVFGAARRGTPRKVLSALVTCALTHLDFDGVKRRVVKMIQGSAASLDPLKIRTLSTVRLQACIR
jgi:hypothetical protein